MESSWFHSGQASALDLTAVTKALLLLPLWNGPSDHIRAWKKYYTWIKVKLNMCSASQLALPQPGQLTSLGLRSWAGITSFKRGHLRPSYCQRTDLRQKIPAQSLLWNWAPAVPAEGLGRRGRRPSEAKPLCYHRAAASHEHADTPWLSRAGQVQLPRETRSGWKHRQLPVRPANIQQQVQITEGGTRSHASLHDVHGCWQSQKWGSWRDCRRYAGAHTSSDGTSPNHRISFLPVPRTCPHPTAFATHTLEQMLQQGCWEPAEQPRCERGRTLQRRRLTCTAGAGLLASAGTAHAGSALTPCSSRKLSSLNSVSWQLK